MRSSELANRKGFTLILSVLLIVVFLGAAVMAVDVGHMRLARADVHSAADAAALAGIEKYAATGDTAQARSEAKLYAAKFKADADTLLVAYHVVGGWDSTKSYPNAFVALGTAGASPADDVVVQHVENYIFAGALAGRIQQHTASATSIAVGIAQKSVSKSTCVAPMVMPLSSLFSQLGEAKGNTDSLTASDVSKLMGVSTDTLSIPLQNGTKVNTLTDVFYQAQLPPVLRADGTKPTGQSNSASWYRSAITCDDGTDPPVGVGDWLGTVPGVDATSTKKGIANASGGNYPVTVEVLLADQIGTPQPGLGCPCLHVAYVGAFTFTQAPDNKGVVGYFSALSPPSGGIVTSGTGSGPLELFTKTHLVY